MTSVDDLLKEHEEFLDCVLNECLLRDAELSKVSSPKTYRSPALQHYVFCSALCMHSSRGVQALNRISRVCKLFVETSLAASKKAEKLLEIHKEELLISSLGRGRVKETDDLFLYGAGASKYKRGGAGWVIPTSSLRSTSPTPRESKGPSTTLSQISAEQKNYGEVSTVPSLVPWKLKAVPFHRHNKKNWQTLWQTIKLLCSKQKRSLTLGLPDSARGYLQKLIRR